MPIKKTIKLSNKEFTSRAPEKVVEMEYKKINDSMSKIRIITETLDFIYNISSDLEKKELLKKSVIDNPKFNDKQKEFDAEEQKNAMLKKNYENLIKNK